LAADGSVPVVAVQPTPEPEEASGDEGEDPPTPLVADIRDDSDLKARLSTVDDLDRIAGGVAMVLATADASPGRPIIGHYGTDDGASRLLPPTAGDG
jgi:hypothetical protein